MKSCTDRAFTILSDVHGELNPQDRTELDEHLNVCPECREERDRLAAMLQSIRDGLPEPALDEVKATALARAVRVSVYEEAERTASRGFFRRFFQGLSSRHALPAIATACVLIIAVGWFESGKFDRPMTTVANMKIASEEAPIVENLEILQNLEILEDFDVIQKLADIVDENENDLI